MAVIYSPLPTPKRPKPQTPHCRPLTNIDPSDSIPQPTKRPKLGISFGGRSSCLSVSKGSPCSNGTVGVHHRHLSFSRVSSAECSSKWHCNGEHLPSCVFLLTLSTHTHTHKHPLRLVPVCRISSATVTEAAAVIWLISLPSIGKKYKQNTQHGHPNTHKHNTNSSRPSKSTKKEKNLIIFFSATASLNKN